MMMSDASACKRPICWELYHTCDEFIHHSSDLAIRSPGLHAMTALAQLTGIHLASDRGGDCLCRWCLGCLQVSDCIHRIWCGIETLASATNSLTAISPCTATTRLEKSTWRRAWNAAGDENSGNGVKFCELSKFSPKSALNRSLREGPLQGSACVPPYSLRRALSSRRSLGQMELKLACKHLGTAL
jgi:hypothetical protein